MMRPSTVSCAAYRRLPLCLGRGGSTELSASWMLTPGPAVRASSKGDDMAERTALQGECSYPSHRSG